jgi:peptide-methionine (R)-S-oxide reductase
LDRQRFLAGLASLALAPLAGCSDPTGEERRGLLAGGSDEFPVRRTEAEWRALLSPSAYAVLFEEWTEAPGSSALTNEHRAGIYLCAACLVPLFRSELKYDSGTGWPTFSGPLDQRIGFKLDVQLIQPRTEYHCLRCGGHQGHVFEDGPPPSGQRYCNNGLALRFVAAGEAMPEPRS